MDAHGLGLVECTLIDPRETWPLRQAVLRPHETEDEMDWAGDALATTFHVGALAGGLVVAIGSAYKEARPGRHDAHAYRLRGMATSPEARGTGVGGALLRHVLDACRERGATELWCNARETASGFYVRFAFETLEGPFELPGTGPHFLMRHLFDR